MIQEKKSRNSEGEGTELVHRTGESTASTTTAGTSQRSTKEKVLGCLGCTVLTGLGLGIGLPLGLAVLNYLYPDCKEVDVWNSADRIIKLKQNGETVETLEPGDYATLLVENQTQYWDVRYSGYDCHQALSSEGDLSLSGSYCTLELTGGTRCTYNYEVFTDDYNNDDDDLFSSSEENQIEKRRTEALSDYRNTRNEADLPKWTSEFSNVKRASSKKETDNNARMWSNSQSQSLFNHKQSSNDKTPEVLEYQSDASISPFV